MHSRLGETNLKKNTWRITKSSVITLIALILIIVTALAGRVSSVPVITQTASTTTVYLDPPTINGTVIGQEFTVNISIRDAPNVHGFGVGLIFNPVLLNCTDFKEGEFLKSAGSTLWIAGTIDNVAGRVNPCACSIFGEAEASGSGRLAYLTFKIKAPGISDLHIQNLKVSSRSGIVFANIIDVYTVVLDTTPHTVVTVSNSTGATAQYGSGFSGHAFNSLEKEISFRVSGPLAGFANVTFPKALVSVGSFDEWQVKVDDVLTSRTATDNGTHYSVYFTYDLGAHQIEITSKRELVVSLEAPATLNFGGSSLLNATVYNSGVNNETNVELQILINGTLANSTVISLLQVDSSYTLSYLWMPDATDTVNYNVTVYAPPVTGEDVTDNNVATKLVRYVVLRELVASLDAPVFLGLGDSSLLNATVYNFGWKNETAIELQMLINGVEVNSTVIGLLQVGYNYTLSYFWSPPAVEASYNVTVYAPPVTGEDVTDNNVATKFVMIGVFFVDPSSGPIGTKATVYGVDFLNQTQVLVTFNDMLIGYAMTDQNGAFTFVFNIPVSDAGEQNLKAFDVSNVSNHVVTTFTVIDVTPLDIETEVGTIHFRGEMAEFYIQIAFKGTLVDATITRATLHYANGTMSLDLTTNVESISKGLYRIPYSTPADATLGSYILAIEASYTTIIVEAKGVSSKSFLLSPTLTAEDALIIDIKDEIATIVIPNLDVIKANLTAIDAELVGLNETIATINSTLGSLQTSINTIDLKVTAIVDDVATIQTTLGTIEGKITSIEGNVATLETDIGIVKVDISSIKGTQETFVIPQYAAVALAFIAAIGAIFIIFLRRKPTA